MAGLDSAQDAQKQGFFWNAPRVWAAFVERFFAEGSPQRCAPRRKALFRRGFCMRGAFARYRTNQQFHANVQY
eukprot:COSAG02_NODE_7337_length_3057_cov_75.754226_4_plen_73_part_00